MNCFIIFTDDESVGNPFRDCPETYFQCLSPNQCIPQNKVCDTKIDCVDASDESSCTCVSRLSPNKLCDRYEDCPNGEDELGCFGCKEDEFACSANFEENPKCFKLIQKCDLHSDCFNGNDEENCFVITKNFQPPKGSMPLSTDDGVLVFHGHHNNQSVVYPVCLDNLKLSFAACKRMLGPDFG